ncbi:hypothetical protein MAPG_03374 [Magnaporthiopsis poae ATCC 64411]|uniref:DNA polymerase V n=1 Tax=Magnaporthiopsis poae (strain ATCC 64411 / 73-15) TaxID=644358 RepID=A0A0C4DTU7_MAGP6|nr:hypothetical protein MAPG_03374 [Magnaporthiopsis poae ATCC 64411]
MCAKRKRPAKGPPNGGTQPANKRARPDPNGGSSLGASGPGLPKALTAKLLADRRPFVEDMKPEDHERERGLYKLLSSTDVEDRLHASDVIISCLFGDGGGSKGTKKKNGKGKDGEASADQDQTDKEGGVPESVLRRHLERRLFRGLSSGSDAARVGFSYVLVEVIRQLIGDRDLASSRYPGLTFEFLLNLLVEKTTTVGKVLGQEERDNWWGRLFGLRCFVQAGVLFNDKTRWKAVLKLLLQLSKKKSWLQPQCGFVIAQAVPLMKRKLVEKTLDELVEAGLAKSPEGLGIWLVAQETFPDIKLPKPWQDPLGTKSLQDAAAVLKGSTQELSDEDGGQTAKQSYTMTQLHFVWGLILDSLKDQQSGKEFRLFWDRVVDQSFFSKTASDHQKLSGFKLFQKVLESYHSSPAMVEAIFSQHLMGCLMNQASAEERNLNRAAVKSLKVVETTVEHYPELLLRILPRLLGGNGTYNFDERTHNKTVEKILRFTRPEDGQAVMEILQTLVKQPTDDGEAERRLRSYADYVSKLVLAGADPKLKDEKDGGSVGGFALLELAKLAYSKEYFDLSERTRSSLRSRLTSSFAKVIKRPEDFMYICDAMLSVEPDAVGMDRDVQSELTAALERLGKLIKKSEKKGSGAAALRMPRQGLALLHAVAILQLYNEEPDALDVLADTKECYEKLKEKEKETGDGSGMAEFLVEILLSMIARPSALMRQASLLVFEAFSPLMTSKALELLTDTLGAEENANGLKALFNAVDEDDMDVDGEDDDDENDDDGLSEIDSDVEFIGMADGDDAEAPDGESDDDDDDGDEGNEDAETTGNDESDHILAQILGTHRLDQDNEAGSSDDDADMTDSEMVALDEKLAEYFKHRVKGNNKRKDKKDAKESVINFKHRVLDFLAVYVKKEAAGSNYLLAFDVLLPLLQHIRTTTNKPLSNKACGIVIDFPKHRKKTKADKTAAAVGEVVDADALLARLKLVHDEAGKDQAHAFAKAATAASLAMVAAIVGAGDNYERVVGVYADTQTAWLQGRVRIQPSFFLEWIHWCQSHAQNQAAKEVAVKEATPAAA